MASAIWRILTDPASWETILNEVKTPYKIAAVEQASAKGRAKVGLMFKKSTVIF